MAPTAGFVTLDIVINRPITLLRKAGLNPILVCFHRTSRTPVFCRHEAMKSERKQIQESNLLADKIEELAVKLKKALPTILAVTAVVVVGLLAYGFYTSVKETESAKGWTALYFADTDTADLTAISSDFKGTTAGLWAKQTAADANMSRALEKVYLDRDLAEKFYNEAIDDYRFVSEKSSDPFQIGRAHFGLAQASEGLGDTTQALSFYRKVITNKAMGVDLISEATKRVAWLESKAGEEFYTWFKKARASAPVLNANPASNTPLPSTPNFSFPNKPVGEPNTAPDAVPAVSPTTANSTTNVTPTDVKSPETVAPEGGSEVPKGNEVPNAAEVKP